MKPRMEMIAAVDKNWAIGNKNQLLVSIPQDQKLFREETMGHVLIMGRKTFESLPGGQALDGRITFVLSRRKGYQARGACVVHSKEELLDALGEHERAGRKIFVAGGSEIYRMLLPYADVVHITRIWNAYEADAYFPNLEKEPGWKITAKSDEQTYFDLEYVFYRYERAGFGCQKGASHQPNTICGVASRLANTHTCVGFAPKGLLTPESEQEFAKI